MLRNKGPHQAEKRVLAHLPGENHNPKFTAGSNTVCQCAFARSCISVWAEPTFKEKIAAKSVKVKVRRAAMVAPCCCMAGKRCPHPALRKMLRSATWSGSNCWGSWGAAGATDDRGSEAGPGCKRNDTERSGPLGRFFRRPFGFGFGSWLSLMWFWCSIREYMVPTEKRRSSENIDGSRGGSDARHRWADHHVSSRTAGCFDRTEQGSSRQGL